MLVPIISVGIHHCRVDQITVTIEWYHPPRVPILSQEDFGSCPDRFRCFVCQRTKGKKYLIEVIRFQRICRNCSPHIDDATIRGLIYFDLRGGFPVTGYPKRTKLKWPKPSDTISKLNPANEVKLEALRKRELKGIEMKK